MSERINIIKNININKKKKHRYKYINNIKPFNTIDIIDTFNDNLPNDTYCPPDKNKYNED